MDRRETEQRKIDRRLACEFGVWHGTELLRPRVCECDLNHGERKHG